MSRTLAHALVLFSLSLAACGDRAAAPERSTQEHGELRPAILKPPPPPATGPELIATMRTMLDKVTDRASAVQVRLGIEVQLRELRARLPKDKEGMVVPSPIFDTLLPGQQDAVAKLLAKARELAQNPDIAAILGSYFSALEDLLQA